MAWHIENVSWTQDKARLQALRERVFIFEWRLPVEAEFDQQDPSAFHILILNDNNDPVATGRLTKSGEIGRIAVKPQYRNLSLYRTLFKALVDIAVKEHVQNLHVQCDIDSVEHHQRLGFTPQGPAFMEAGIPRQRMYCSVDKFTLPDVHRMH